MEQRQAQLTEGEGQVVKTERQKERERDINSGTFLSVPAIFGVHVPCAVAAASGAAAAAAAIYLL